MLKSFTIPTESLAMSLLVRGVVVLALCLLVSACTPTSASHWETAHGNVPLKTSKAFEYIGPY